MSRERTLVKLTTEIKARRRKRGLPLEVIIEEQQRGKGFRGEVYEPLYRNDHVCRRHLLIDTGNVERDLKRRFNRVSRRLAKRELALGRVA